MTALFAAFQKAAPSIAEQFRPNADPQARLVSRTKHGREIPNQEFFEMWNVQSSIFRRKMKGRKEIEAIPAPDWSARLTGGIKSVSFMYSDLIRLLKTHEVDFEWLNEVAVVGSDRVYIPVIHMTDVINEMYKFESHIVVNDSVGNNVHLVLEAL